MYKCTMYKCTMYSEHSPRVDSDGIQGTETRTWIVTSSTFFHETVNPEVAEVEMIK